MRISRAGIWTSNGCGRRALRAFTFIELIVVLIVLGISAAVVFPKVDELLLREPEPWRSARKLMRLAERAHEMAIATESALLLHIDLETGRYWITSKQAGNLSADAAGQRSLGGQLPEDVTFTDVKLQGEDRALESVLTIEFSPEGWCDPAVLDITSSDGRTVQLTIDEWFGAMNLNGDRSAG
jgi:prepilin-type N-terminal cleavage/methylation domain-containing protein